MTRVETTPVHGSLEATTGTGKRHKAMSGSAIPPEVAFAPYDQEPDLDRGALLTTDGTPAATLRHPIHRGSPKVLTDSDVSKIHHKDKRNRSFRDVDSGLEAEFFGFRNGEIVSMMNEGDPFYTKLLEYNSQAENEGKNPDPLVQNLLKMKQKVDGKEEVPFTREMLRNCVELTFAHGKDIHERNRMYLDSLKTLVGLAEEVDIKLAPLSNIPHREITKEDITTDAYTHHATFTVQGWEKAQFFDIASIQPHVEIVHQEAARNAINYLQHLTPILFAATLSAPFMDGRIHPDVEKRYGEALDDKDDSWKTATSDQIDNGPWHSVRALGRFTGSPSGGIIRVPVEIPEEEFMDTVDEMVSTGEIATAGRAAGGHHTDRVRIDIPEHGTLEHCGFDTAGGRIERVVALREFVRALDWKMQMHYVNGTFEEKTKQFASILGQEPTEDSFEQAHRNTIAVAQDGPKAILEGMDGKEHSVRSLWSDLIKFVQEPLYQGQDGTEQLIDYSGLPPGVVEELDNAYIDPSTFFEKYKDKNGHTSVTGYYETGIGTLSQWLTQAAEDRIARGYSEKEAIMDVTEDMGDAYHTHIKNADHIDIKNLYRPQVHVLFQPPVPSPPFLP